MAGSIKLTDFKNQIQDVARPNRFWITITGNIAADLGWAEEPMAFACKSASIPSRTVNTIELSWQGMKTKIAGDPSFEDITLNFHNTYDWSVKNFFETWLQAISDEASNTRLDPAAYKAEIIIEHLGRTDADVLATYVLEGAFPTNIAAISLSQDSGDTPEDFDVNFAYDTFYRRAGKGVGSAVPGILER